MTDTETRPWWMEPRKPRKARPVTPCCSRVIPADAARAVGRFDPDGPIGFRAADTADAPLRDTRELAVADWHAARCSAAAV